MPRERGVVNTWNGEKQFGFVSVTNGKADAFLHSENVRDRDLRDEVKKKGFKRGDKIRFDLEPPETGRGKMVAVNIELEAGRVEGQSAEAEALVVHQAQDVHVAGGVLRAIGALQRHGEVGVLQHHGAPCVAGTRTRGVLAVGAVIREALAADGESGDYCSLIKAMPLGDRWVQLVGMHYDFNT
eukprot:CAMPEP_0172719642 /NCGR_PEP_ID=MMETSP1074-20121228/75624_1 /TAXON_ID=2916 /ORGANISM="Ceratium fusus, Strain PA161109" /LENGTH=183 /DNA_ID=CAMNT_0013545021 /DNA_START=175 /DNA_END=725 /DNA_ORIENTATION=+